MINHQTTVRRRKNDLLLRRISRCRLSAAGAGSRFALLIALIVGCTPFPTRFDRIEDDKLRPLAAVYTPRPEAAPGDTLTATFYFAGNRVVSVDSIMVSYNVVNNIYGSVDTATELQPAQILDSSGHLPDSLAITFRVPGNVFETEMMPDGKFDQTLRSFGVPDSLLAVGHQIVTALDSGNTALLSAVPPSLLMMAAPAFQLILSKPAYFFITAHSENGMTLKTRAQFTVRYNTRLQKLPALSVPFAANENPEVRWVGIYAVKGKVSGMFHPSKSEFDGRYSLHYFHNELHPDSVVDTMVIDTGYTYFAAADSGIVALIDSAGNLIQDTSRQWVHTLTMQNIDTLVQEGFSYRWFYENLDPAALPIDSLLVLPGGMINSSIIPLMPPLDTKMRHFKIWVAAYDNMDGEFNRPRGMTLRSIEGYFSFTDAYKRRIALSN
jgi:hypothetical protein